MLYFREGLNLEISKKMEELILGVIVLVLGLSLVPTVSNAATAAAVNATGITLTIIPFVPVVYVIIILAVAFMILRDASKS